MTEANKPKDLKLNFMPEQRRLPYREQIRTDELTKPGLRRVLEAMKLVQKEAPGLFKKAVLASTQTRGRQDGGGQMSL